MMGIEKKYKNKITYNNIVNFKIFLILGYRSRKIQYNLLMG
jgi:hypothetical protein